MRPARRLAGLCLGVAVALGFAPRRILAVHEHHRTRHRPQAAGHYVSSTLGSHSAAIPRCASMAQDRTGGPQCPGPRRHTPAGGRRREADALAVATLDRAQPTGSCT